MKMKKIVLIVLGILVVFLLCGAGYNFYLWQYEEVCVAYQKNVTAEWKCSDPFYFPQTCAWYHEYIDTDVCVEYMLVKKTDIEPFVYLFDWCEVYPLSDDCPEINASVINSTDLWYGWNWSFFPKLEVFNSTNFV